MKNRVTIHIVCLLVVFCGCTSERRVCQNKYEPVACSIFFTMLASDPRIVNGMSGILVSCAAQLQYQSRCNKESGLPTVIDP